MASGASPRPPRLRQWFPEDMEKALQEVRSVMMRGYFQLLKSVLDAHDFHSHPEDIWNCDDSYRPK